MLPTSKLQSNTVPDPLPAPNADASAISEKRGILQRIAELLHPSPDSVPDLIEQLAQAQEKGLIEADARNMLEGVLRIGDMTAGDVMVAAPKIDLLNIDDSIEVLLEQVIETAHSRFPVFEGERENIIGILMAKDLIKRIRSPELNLKTLLRPAVFVPETKRLNQLLREFKANRNHLAVVIDEFGQLAGLVTIEDVLEQIVGEIEDEFDEADEGGDIYGLSGNTWRVDGDTAIERINDAFDLDIPDDEFDTIGGLVSHDMGHVPKRGETYVAYGLRFEVMHAKGGAVRWFKVTLLPKTEAEKVGTGVSDDARA